MTSVGVMMHPSYRLLCIANRSNDLDDICINQGLLFSLHASPLEPSDANVSWTNNTIITIKDVILCLATVQVFL